MNNLPFKLLCCFYLTVHARIREDGCQITDNTRYESTLDIEVPCNNSSSWLSCDSTCSEGITRCKDNTTAVLQCNCVTFDKENKITEAGKCMYNCGYFQDANILYNPLPNNPDIVTDYMCEKQFNRTGTLCGKCKDGFFTLAYSYDMTCIECANGKSNWLKYMLAAFLPLTIFYFIIVFLQINITSSHFNAFVYFSHMLSVPAISRVFLVSNRNRKTFQTLIRVLGNFYGIWNLDFFRFNKLNICLGSNTLQTLALDLLIGAYPVLLIILSYTLVNLYDK